MLRSWGIQVDEAFFLGGIEKTRVLNGFKPHLFFDDQLAHVTDAAGHVPPGTAVINASKEDRARPA
jgi:5'-nucleotidase